MRTVGNFIGVLRFRSVGSEQMVVRDQIVGSWFYFLKMSHDSEVGVISIRVNSKTVLNTIKQIPDTVGLEVRCAIIQNLSTLAPTVVLPTLSYARGHFILVTFVNSIFLNIFSVVMIFLRVLKQGKQHSSQF